MLYYLIMMHRRRDITLFTFHFHICTYHTYILVCLSFKTFLEATRYCTTYQLRHELFHDILHNNEKKKELYIYFMVLLFNIVIGI